MTTETLKNNIRDVKSLLFWKAIIAELFGTGLLVFLGCSSCLGKSWGHKPNILEISFTFGLAVATVVYGIADISGGHINPAVTVSMLFTRRITAIKAVLYVIAQSIGSVGGIFFLSRLTLEGHNGELGHTAVNSAVKSVTTGVFIEAVITFVLVFTVFACCDSNRQQSGSIPLTIGLSVFVCHIAAIKYTGSSMNPARSFGPACVRQDWTNHWVYWVGPISGGVAAGFLYDFVFAKNACCFKVLEFLKPNYDANKKFYCGDEFTVVSDGKESEEKRMIQEL